MKKKKILVVIEWKLRPGGWSFLNALKQSGHQFDVLEKEICQKYGTRFKRNIRLWYGFFWLAFHGYLKRDAYNAVISWQGVVGLWYGFFKRFVNPSGAPLILMGFFLKEQASSISSYLRLKFVKLAMPQIDFVVCYSRYEVRKCQRLFPAMKDRFVYIPLGINTLRKDIATGNAYPTGNYILSSGSSNRDYATLFKAVRDLGIKVVVIATRYNIQGLNVPQNVEVYYDVYGEEYYRHFWGCQFVIVPLDDPHVSSGQMVLLHALIFGKAPIVTRTNTTIDYITDGQTGLLSEPHDADDLRKKIVWLIDNPDKRQEIAENGKKEVFEKYSIIQMAGRVNSLIERL